MSEWVLLHNDSLATSVDAFHLVFTLWLILGSFLIFRYKRLAVLHWSSMAVTLLSKLLFLNCPLTVLQKALENYGSNRVEIGTGFVASLLGQLTGFSPPEVAIAVGIWMLFIFATFFLLFQTLSRRFAAE